MINHRSSTTATAGLLAAIGTFQAGLALGAPWGRLAYGGQRPGRLPGRHRAVSAVATVAYVTAADGGSPAARRRLLAGVTGFTAAGVLANGASRSRPERVLWTPVCAVTAVTAWSARRGLVG